MVSVFALIHSPLLGPASWHGVQEALAVEGFTSVVPELARAEVGLEPHYVQHAESVAAVLRQIHDEIILVGHSGAGPLLPHIARLTGLRPMAYIFVDAGLPDPSRPRKGAGPFAVHIDQGLLAGRCFPEWTDEDLADLIPDKAERQTILSQVRPQGAAFWNEVVPSGDWWPDAPCGYLRFGSNPSYDDAADEAIRRGWPVKVLPGGHFHLVVDPVGVATALVLISRDLQVPLVARR